MGTRWASLYSWHSYRLGLATALHAAGIPDEVIMVMCHWVDPNSLRSYRRLSHAEQASALDKAAAVPVSLLQPRNAPVVNEDVHYAAFIQDLAPLSLTLRRQPATLQTSGEGHIGLKYSPVPVSHTRQPPK